MAKDSERQIAKALYFQGKPQNHIAEMVNVTEKTVSKWVEKYNWKVERDARLNGGKDRIENLRRLIGRLTDERIKIMDDAEAGNYTKDETAADLEKKGIRLADEISKWTKALEQLDSENRISLSTHIEVMDSIFGAVQDYNPALYSKTIEFQEEYLATLSTRYK